MIQKELEALCKKLEHFETPLWAVDEILSREILTENVIDPCVGAGVLSNALRSHNYNVASYDIHDWGYPDTIVKNFLDLDGYDIQNVEFSILMNPPFSLAEAFVKKGFTLGARKIVMFQRFSFWESHARSKFWNQFPPNRIYVCGDRADCWRYDLPKDDKGNRYDPVTGKKLSSTPTAHAWFVFEQGHPAGTVLGHIRK